MTEISRRQFCMVGTAAMFTALGLAGCGGGSGSATSASATLKDGTYTGQSSTLDANVDGDGYGIIKITVENGKIVDAEFQAFQVDGTPKDKDYGKDGAYYAVAQKAVSTGDDYTAALIEAGTIDGVDAISGATYLYEQFVEATEAALKEASK
ncbi:MAG: FMN-binding protein [Eggerthellaceae bacterium]|nr:FMN-binding protein [Eggerthellaceae bacterium]